MRKGKERIHKKLTAKLNYVLNQLRQGKLETPSGLLTLCRIFQVLVHLENIVLFSISYTFSLWPIFGKEVFSQNAISQSTTHVGKTRKIMPNSQKCTHDIFLVSLIFSYNKSILYITQKVRVVGGVPVVENLS